MTEEKEQDKPPQDKPQEETKAPAKAEKQQEKEKPEPPPAQAPKAKQRKKVTRMTLEEIEKDLKSVQEKMGGFRSDFARHLLARKKELTAPGPKS
ncbi:MAG: hypothetical protein HY588_00670 [Candidatus Omnitrophica bacterium]|nr:hypothetical protein [Candidatus Omnitrophota bacterium]